jgi:hypothetical protein
MPRTKTYSAESGYVYQYQFTGDRDLDGGHVYCFAISVDRADPFVMEIRVPAASLRDWEASESRTLTPTERYAIAKMKLFAVLDSATSPQELKVPHTVTPSEVRDILRTLDI